MTVGEALWKRGEGKGFDEARLKNMLISIQLCYNELWWAELIPDFTEAPEERIRLALIRPLTKKEDS